MAEETAFTFKSWYEKNGPSLNRGRRAKYNSDPSYRKRVLNWNQEARSRRRELRNSEKKVEECAVRVPAGNCPWKVVSSKQGTFFTIGALARAVGKSVQTVRLWEVSGMIPVTSNRSKKGDRLYSATQIESIYADLKSRGKIEENALRPKAETSGFYYTIRFQDGVISREMLFRVGVLSKIVNKTVVTLEQMEQRGLLPVTPLRYSGTMYRLYSARMIEVVHEALLSRPSGIEDRERFRKEISDGWYAAGYAKARVVKSSASATY